MKKGRREEREEEVEALNVRGEGRRKCACAYIPGGEGEGEEIKRIELTEICMREGETDRET